MRTLFGGLGPLAEVYESVDWGATPLGDVSTWDETLLGVVDVMSNTRFPITLFWGPELTLVYNEAYVPLIADKHPGALGRPAHEVFPEAWDLIGPMMQSVMAGRGATWVEDEYVPLHRRGYLEECYFTFSYSAVRGPTGTVEGVMDIATETTAQVIARRRIALLGRLTDGLADVQDVDEVARIALPLLEAAAGDFRAVDIRLPGAAGADVPGLPVGRPSLSGETVERHGEGRVAWLPLALPDSTERSWLVVLLSPLLAPDDDYLSFLRLVAASLRQALDRVRVRAAERRTAEVQRSMTEAFQRSLLPEPVGSARLQVAVRYQPAVELAQIGGDWYDYFALPDASLTVVIGDVAGHDQHAAAAMSQVRNLVRGVAYTMHPDTPGRVLDGLDRAMRGTAPDIVATAVLAQITAAEGDGLTLTWSNAGHPAPILIDAEGTARLLDTPPDLLLGLDEGVARADHRLDLEPGSTVLLYTDGLIERRGAPLSRGLSWLVDVLQGQHGTDVEKLCDYLLTNAFAVEDDVALLVLRA